MLAGNWGPRYTVIKGCLGWFIGLVAGNALLTPEERVYAKNDWPCFEQAGGSQGLTKRHLDFSPNAILGGGNSNIFYFHPYLGKIPNLTNIFQRG